LARSKSTTERAMTLTRMKPSGDAVMPNPHTAERGLRQAARQFRRALNRPSSSPNLEE